MTQSTKRLPPSTRAATAYTDRAGRVVNNSPGEPERKTFSITTMLDDETGRLYLLAKSMGMAVASIYRHNLTIFAELLREEDARLGEDASMSKKLHEAARLLSMSHIVRHEGIPDCADICDFLEVSGRTDLARFVSELSLVGMALLIDRARHCVAYPGDSAEDWMHSSRGAGQTDAHASHATHNNGSDAGEIASTLERNAS